MPRSTGPTAKQRGIVRARSRSNCIRCSRPGVQIHHRKPRKLGGTRRPEINNLSNLALLCLDCHQWIESFRTLARDAGWLVRDGDDPERIPLVNVWAEVFWLDDQGGITFMDGKAVPQ